MTDVSFHPPLKATARDRMAAVIEAFCDHTGTSPHSISGLLVNDSKFVPRVLDGSNFTVGQYDRIMGGLSRLWPRDLDWPADVPRPYPADLPPEIEGPARRRIAAAEDRKLRQELKEAQQDGRAA